MYPACTTGKVYALLGNIMEACLPRSSPKGRYVAYVLSWNPYYWWCGLFLVGWHQNVATNSVHVSAQH